MIEKDRILSKSIRGGIVVLGFVAAQYSVGFIIQIILARILDPKHFGTLAFSMMVAMFFQRLCNTHGDKYIIKEKNNIHTKLDTVFTLEILVTLFFIGIVLILAPIIMNILGKPEQTLYVQVLTVSFLYLPLSKPICILEKNLSFFNARYPKIISQIIGGAAGITMATMGFGVWSLITWKISTFLIENLIIWCTIQYRPKFRIDYALMKEIIQYSWPLMASGILVYFYWHIDYYYVGHILGEKQLGYYWLAFQVSHYFLSIKASIISVVFPAFSKLKNPNDIKSGFEILTKMTMYIYMLPTIVVLVLGEDLITLLFGTKWTPATTAFQIFMFLTMLRAVTSFWDPVFLLFGKTKVLLKLTIINSFVIGILGYIFTKSHGIVGMSCTVLLSILLITPLAAFQLKKLIQTSYVDILKKPTIYLIGLVIAYYSLFLALSTNLNSIIMAMGLSTGAFVIVYSAVIYRENKTLFTQVRRSL